VDRYFCRLSRLVARQHNRRPLMSQLSSAAVSLSGNLVRAWLAIAVGVCVVAPRLDAREIARPKQVLMLNSTRQNEQFFVVSEREVPRLLAEGLGERVEYYTEYFDFNRFPHPHYDNVYLDFLRHKYAGRRFDLLLLMGDAAMDFMATHRNDLFVDT